ncbi:MAG: hypothetical protein ACM3O3_06650 [Syntrophothermus sp.]
MLNKFLFTFMLAVCMAFTIKAQQDTIIIDDEEVNEDSLNVDDSNDEWDEWSEDWEKDWKNHEKNWDWNFDFFSHKKPAISLVYGQANAKIKDFIPAFAKPYIAEIKIGYSSERNNEGLLINSFDYLYLSNISTKLNQKDPAINDLENDLWRFGFGNSKGYSYRLGTAARITPYYTTTFGWSKLNMFDQPQDSLSNWKLDRFEKTLKFGTSSEGGIKIQIIDQLAIDASYERAIIFPRHLFWKWAGSALIEGAAMWGVDEFVQAVGENSPWATPIVNFVLKNGLAYGLYELRQKNMNWPFESESPLGYDQFKVGLTFTF